MERFIKQVGGGARTSRPLDRADATAAMEHLVRGQADPVQVGAFLMALRMKGETSAELAGFADALAPFRQPSPATAEVLDVDAHGDGHAGRPSLLPVAACAAAALGVPVCLGVDGDSPFAKHGLRGSLAAIHRRPPFGVERARRDLAASGVAVIDLGEACPPLARLIDLRRLLGRRSFAHTVAKLFSPLGCSRRLVGVFHAPYLESTAQALGLLGVERGVVVQALGGLPEARPGRILRAAHANAPRAAAIDCRPLAPLDEDALPGAGDEAATLSDTNDAAARDTHRAMAGEAALARRAAATAGLMVYAATGADPLDAAAAAEVALRSGRARAIADQVT